MRISSPWGGVRPLWVPCKDWRKPFHTETFRWVSLTGGVAAYIEGVATGRTAQNVHLIPAPLMVSSQELAHSLKVERHVVDVMDMARTANYALVGVGSVANQATLITSGYATGSQFEAFRRQGAVGDLIAIFYDKDGNVLDLPFHDNLIGLDLQALREIPNVVAAACGANKGRGH